MADFEGEPIVGRTELTARDFTAVWAILPQNRQVFDRFALWVLLIPLVRLMRGILSVGDSDIPVYPSWPLTMVFPLVLAAVLAFGLWKVRNQWARNTVADLRGAEGVEFRFDSAGFSVRAPGRQVELAWSSLYRSIETAQAFVIYTAPATVMVVPKRAFSTGEQTRLQVCLPQLVSNRPLRGTDSWRPLGRKVLIWFALVLVFFVIWRVFSPR